MKSIIPPKVLKDAPLGKTTPTIDSYTPAFIFPIPRISQREALDITQEFFASGMDIWRNYELSWLNEKGKPMVAVGVMTFPFSTPNLIESKSLKLYFNSFNQTKFRDSNSVKETIEKDLSQSVGGPVEVKITPLHQYVGCKLEMLDAESLDDLEIECDTYHVHPQYLTTTSEIVEETLSSDLLKSKCPVTGQPDWASIVIHYKGPKIERASLLKYIISYRNHLAFHEQCVERIFRDIKTRCKSSLLTVMGAYTRRGGLDINPIRSSCPPLALNRAYSMDAFKHMRLVRQ